jgi:DcaP outer membrane protein
MGIRLKLRRPLSVQTVSTCAALFMLGAIAAPAWAATSAAISAVTSSMEIYGTAQADYIQDFNRVNPDWTSTLRPSKIAVPEGLYGSNGQAIISVKQSRFGVKGTAPIEGGEELTYKFDFDLYGVGSNAGQTTFRLQNIYAEWRGLLAGQTDTNWMDGSIFPDTIDYWGPAGMVYVRTPQLRWTVPTAIDKFYIAIETPNTDIDLGKAREIDPGLAANLQSDNKMPDFTARYRAERDWGHVQLAGIVRYLGWDTLGTPGNNPSGHVTGWGLNLTSNIKSIGEDMVHLGVVYGDGIASYMNDGGVDIAPQCQLNFLGNSCVAGTVKAKAVPLWGVTAYYDHYWMDGFSTAFGYSETHVDNQSGQEGSAFQSGQYASVNLLWRPAKNIMMGAEGLWGRLTQNSGQSGKDTRIQFSVQYKFSSK